MWRCVLAPENKLLTKYIARYAPEQVAPKLVLPTLGRTELNAFYARVVRANDPLRDAGLTPELRASMRNQVGPLLPTLLTACVRGLRDCPDFAARLGADVDSIDDLAEQQMAVQSGLKTMEAVHDRAEQCWYAVTDAGERRLYGLLGAITRSVGEPATQTPAQRMVNAALHPALMLYDQATSQRRQSGEQVGQRTADVQAQTQQVGRSMGQQQRIHTMLEAFAADQGLLPDKDTAAGAKTKTARRPGKKEG